MSGTGGWEAQRAILDRLRQPAPSLRILFMTPEKIARSDTLMRALHELRGPRAAGPHHRGRGALRQQLGPRALLVLPCCRIALSQSLTERIMTLTCSSALP